MVFLTLWLKNWRLRTHIKWLTSDNISIICVKNSWINFWRSWFANVSVSLVYINGSTAKTLQKNNWPWKYYITFSFKKQFMLWWFLNYTYMLITISYSFVILRMNYFSNIICYDHFVYLFSWNWDTQTFRTLK